jgi:low temperature requirement protein LtrA
MENIEKERHASWLENFYDLIVAIVVFQLSSILNHNVSVSGFLHLLRYLYLSFGHGSELPSIIQGLKLMI